ncbi:transposase [Deinococcus sp. NW-56]|uniref:transposase n=1 Tax=Deinococcus sp. NW-56 TaxID=2080419 RepID=UPI001319D5A6
MKRRSLARHGVPARRPSNWQRRTPEAFTHDDFQIDWDKKDVRCPQGYLNSAWTEVPRRGTTFITVKFRYQTCGRCPVRHRCTNADTLKRGRTLHLVLRIDFVR